MDIHITPKPKPNQLVRVNELEWRPLAEPGVTGVFVKVLRFDEEQGRAPTILLKFAPGARYPAHNHPGGEEVLVLEGEVQFGGDRLRTGDYLHTAPNRKHAVYSERGCVVFVSVPEEVELIRRPQA